MRTHKIFHLEIFCTGDYLPASSSTSYPWRCAILTQDRGCRTPLKLLWAGYAKSPFPPRDLDPESLFQPLRRPSTEFNSLWSTRNSAFLHCTYVVLVPLLRANTLSPFTELWLSYVRISFVFLVKGYASPTNLAAPLNDTVRKSALLGSLGRSWLPKLVYKESKRIESWPHLRCILGENHAVFARWCVQMG